ncbi:DUF4272 domain-containing protein [Paenactinomyces guangxiensis]|uniref:DUF4272 domain-containing protein n=1 Tax=Paenactinomyces guangxiensis TaxID=1490290 RepID=A0A7W1WU39_9BACL|nr:DUF4272 domain-containing protein [Paenactinomyces guangxiensis]MBA4496057.1 DUF4272 domain-containing protein [Paenactinomyces guangxiensis]MBH8593145.1 DUF4272 domain-containing protein [Paenactinomyces guangxiensis]
MTDSDTNKQISIDQNSGRVNMIYNFPVYPEKNEVHLRSAEDVAKRALSLHLLLGVIFYQEPEKVTEWAIQEGLWDSLSPQEHSFFTVPISDLSPAEKKWKQKAIQSSLLTWRVEGLQALLWSMNLVEELDLPIERCDGNMLGEVLPELGESLQTFIAQARLRPVEEIVHMLEQHFQIYNHQVEAFANEEDLQFDMLITYERIHALNWVCGLISQWDD